ncbi:MAG: hypothetical protein A2Y40_09615 [Candidatus Margulisbacteria bacterium GWF2_35_9]|nr:MAG: hypothetical protein A2Y40_09615 [Candidatus Margulisbacteria bacterium GWF2_35_9]
MKRIIFSLFLIITLVLITLFLLSKQPPAILTRPINIELNGVDKNADHILIEAISDEKIITLNLKASNTSIKNIIMLPDGTWRLNAIAKDKSAYVLNEANIMIDVTTENAIAKLFFYGQQWDDLLVVSGRNIIDHKNNRVDLKGFGLTNGVYTMADPADLETSQFFLTRDDYRTMSLFGVNSVRFYLQYHWLDEDKRDSFFEYFDKQVQYARENGIYIILNLHFLGMAEDVANKQADGFYRGNQYSEYKLIDFWDVISKRYRYEPVIGGYDLINEPNCRVGFSETQLYNTYQSIINVIRNNNDSHMIFVSEPVAKYDNPSENYHDVVGAFKKLDDANIVYEYHWYQPGEFTHQAAFYDPYNDLGAHYPFMRHKESYKGGYYNNAYWNHTENNNWQLYQSKWVNLAEQSNCKVNTVEDMFSISLSGGGASGKIWYDDVMIEAKDLTTGHITKLPVANADMSIARNYDGWNPTPSLSSLPSRWYAYNNEESTGIQFIWDKSVDHTGNGSGALLIDGTKAKWMGSNQWATWGQSGGSLAKLYPISNNHSYRASAWIMMQGNPEYSASLSFNIHKTKKQFIDKAFMKSAIKNYYESWAEKNDVPLYCGEFGLTDPSRMQFTKTTFSNEEQAQWVTDMLNILSANTKNWAYHTYKNYSYRPDLFGLFDKNMENEPLQQIVKEYL